MQLPAHFVRIYALHDRRERESADHPQSPFTFPDYPSPGLRSVIYIGEVPEAYLSGLRLRRGWLMRGLGGSKHNAKQVREFAEEISAEDVLRDPRRPRAPHPATWYLTISVEDVVELPEDSGDRLLGVDFRSFAQLDNDDFLKRHARTLDKLSLVAALAVAPYRYRWCPCDGPLIDLPTGITLSPIRNIALPVRVLTGAALQNLDLSPVIRMAPNAVLDSIPVLTQFYLSAMIEDEPIARFFDAFRALERLWEDKRKLSLAQRAPANIETTASEQLESIKAYNRKKGSRRRNFATVALALNPAGADRDLKTFDMLEGIRNDLVHGNRQLGPNDAPDEATFELLHKYLAALE